MGTKRALHPTASALFSAARLAVLGVLFRDPERSYYVNEIVRAAGVGTGAVQRELQRLTRAEILSRSKRGNLVLYQVNSANPVFPDLLAIVNKTTGVGGLLRTALTPLRNKIDSAFVYGSVARRAERSSSDVDIMIIGDVSLLEVVSLTRGVEQQIGREINPTIFPTREFQTKFQAGDAFLKWVLMQPRLSIFGIVDESGNMAP